ncbi:quinol monooxygenase YgiN [Amycolatopsis jiangsuensis]|uniref:Quinol monooxygenase YgiN n=1 Tax=Amycolatopsis jiangsuensis TaxID=1181879 RepID=A0A840J6J2_9PSEU|nr:quinol monooxygenase YgiN [Amycolatopsis jiangsuensis]
MHLDVHQQTDDPTKFVLYEVYTDEEAFRGAHHETPHYDTWRAAAVDLVAAGGHTNIYCTPAFPEDIT